MTNARRRWSALATAIVLATAIAKPTAIASAAAVATSPLATAAVQRDPVASFRALVARLDRSPTRPDPVVLASLGPSITDLRFLWSADPTLGEAIASALLDFVGVTLATYDPAGREELAYEVGAARAAAAETLSARCDATFVQ